MTDALARIESCLDSYLAAHPRPFPPATEWPSR